MTTRETKLIIICMAMAALIVYSVVVGQRQSEQRMQRIEQNQRVIDKRQRDTSATVDDMKQKMVTTDTIEKLPIDYRTRMRHYKWIQVDRRGGNYIARMDETFAGTPLEGRGREFLTAALDAGIEPRLSAAIAMRESQLGRAIPPGSFNAWGMTAGTAPGYAAVSARGPDGVRGYQAFPDWSTAIKEHARFIRRTWGPVQSAYAMHGYAADGAWADAVERARRSI